MFYFLIPSAFVIAGGYFLLKILQDYLKAKATHTWPSIQGIVVESRIEEKGSSGEFSYKPVVVYEYEINGFLLKSSDLIVGGQSLTNGSYFQAGKLVRDFPLGQTVDVIYNPANPKDSVLLKGRFSKDFYLQAGFVLFLFVMAILSYCLVLI
jgi:hypothetical protein